MASERQTGESDGFHDSRQQAKQCRHSRPTQQGNLLLLTIILTWEEGTVAFACDLGEDRGRSGCRVRDEREPFLVCRPADRCVVLNDLKLEAFLLVADCVTFFHTTPAHME
jgi:hypothetical protein